jgi:glutathione S-transferase
MLRLYDFHDSGNGYKVRLLLAMLGIAYDYVEVDILAGETRTPAFLEKNPNGRIPVLDLGGGACLAESDAILFYLAEGTPFLPANRLERARVLQWMFFEQYSHKPYIAVCRFWLRHLEMTGERQTLLAEKQERGRAALEVMERHLEGRAFFVGEDRTIADIALYAYTHVAPEGGFDLTGFPGVRAWLERIRSQSGHVPITGTSD